MIALAQPSRSFRFDLRDLFIHALLPRVTRTMAAESPAFRFYAADFLNDEDVLCMTLEEIGLYTILLCRAWIEGSLPASEFELSRIVSIQNRKFSRIFSKVSKKFVERGDGRLVNPRMEFEREKQKLFSASQAQKRQKNGTGDLPGLNTGLSGDLPELNTGSTSVRPARPQFSFSFTFTEYLASLDTGRARPSDEWAFATWFVHLGLLASAIQADRALDFAATVLREDLVAAKALLATHGAAEVEARSRRFFAAIADRRIRRTCSIAGLRDCWTWRELASEPAAAAHADLSRGYEAV